MAKLEINIPNEQVERVVDALCHVGGYQGDSGDAAARREFARAMVREYVRRTVLQHEQRQAAGAALSAVVIDPVDVE